MISLACRSIRSSLRCPYMEASSSKQTLRPLCATSFRHHAENSSKESTANLAETSKSPDEKMKSPLSVDLESNHSTLSATTLPGQELPESVRATTDALPSSRSNTSFSFTRGHEPFHLHVQSTRNNTILTLTTPDGSPLTNVSCGTVGFRKAARSTYDAGYRTALTMFQRIEENRVSWRIATLELVWKGFGQGREAVYRALMTDDGTPVRKLVRRMRDTTRIKIGGVRPRKRRSKYDYYDTIFSDTLSNSALMQSTFTENRFSTRTCVMS